MDVKNFIQIDAKYFTKVYGVHVKGKKNAKVARWMSVCLTLTLLLRNDKMTKIFT